LKIDVSLEFRNIEHEELSKFLEGIRQISKHHNVSTVHLTILVPTEALFKRKEE